MIIVIARFREKISGTEQIREFNRGFIVQTWEEYTLLRHQLRNAAHSIESSKIESLYGEFK